MQKAESVCNPSAYRYLDHEAAKGKFNDALEALFNGSRLIDDALDLLRSRFRSLPYITPARADELASQTKTALKGYEPSTLSDPAIKMIAESDEGIAIITHARS